MSYIKHEFSKCNAHDEFSFDGDEELEPQTELQFVYVVMASNMSNKPFSRFDLVVCGHMNMVETISNHPKL